MEVPLWVAEDSAAVDLLQSVLVDQAHATGIRPYPYPLIRAHEIAVVKMDDHDQLSDRIEQELDPRVLPSRNRTNNPKKMPKQGRGYKWSQLRSDVYSAPIPRLRGRLQVSQTDAPAFGQMVRIPLEDGGPYSDWCTTSTSMTTGWCASSLRHQASDEVIEDNRKNRNMPVEMSVVFIGWQQGISISQTLPPRPPLSLDTIFPCELERWRPSRHGRFGYLRHCCATSNCPLRTC